MTIKPYLFFEGRCEEALDFYKAALGAEVTMLMRFQDNPEPNNGQGCAEGFTPPSGDKVMHAEFRIGDSALMASDGMATGKPVFQGISLSVERPTEAEARQVFERLADGGQVQMPLGKTFFSPAFGMVADRFGVSWMVIASA